MADDATIRQEIQNLQNRLSWLDGERRITNQRLAEMEQRIELQNREIDARDQRIQTLEEQLTVARKKLNGIVDVEDRLKVLRQEVVGMIDKVDERRQSAELEADRLRTVERQVTNRELESVRVQLPAIKRLQEQVDQTKTEDTRLLQQIANLQTQFPAYDSRIDSLNSATSYQKETVKQVQRQISRQDTTLIELGKRAESAEDRLGSLQISIGRLEASMQDFTRNQVTSRQQLREWMEQAKTADFDRTQRVATWQSEFEAYKQEMQKFHTQYLQVANQTREARAALQTLNEWRGQIERLQREEAEKNRVENERMRAQFQGFQDENNKFWKRVEIEATQRNSAGDRQFQQLSATLIELEGKLDKLRLEKDTLLRIQTAQSDAIKRFPTLWLEEVEKARSNDPNRRRSAAFAPIPDET